MTLQPEDYIKGLLQNNRSVLQEIYKNYAPSVRRYVLQKGGTAEEAMDIFQDALMIVYQKAQQPDFELTSHFYAYLLGVCNNVLKKKLQKKQKEGVTFDLETVLVIDEGFEPLIAERERDKVFEDNFQKLGKLCQDILQLFFAKKNMQEIAQTLQLENEDGVRNRKYKCQKKLTAFIKADLRYAELNHKK